MKRARAALLAAAAGALLLSCGKSGPPLPPLEGMIPRITDLETWQVGNEVHATFTLPRRPGHPEIDYATRAVELWRRPHAEKANAPATRPPAVRPTTAGGRTASTEIALKDFTDGATLATSLSGEGLLDWLGTESPTLVERVPDELLGTSLEYAVVLKTNVRQRGTVSNLVAIEVKQPPPRPQDVTAVVHEGGITISWTPGPLPPPEPAAAAAAPADGTPAEPSAEPPPAEAAAAVTAPPGLPAAGPAAGPRLERPPADQSIRFNVYRALADGPYSKTPLNAQPVDEPPYEDRDVETGARYRHAVRSVQAKVESEAVEAAAVEYRDVFPPAVPTGLRLILDPGGAVNLLWNPNDEPDLAGYAAWRRRPGEEWLRIDDGRLAVATFVDTTASPGPWEYAVSALDRSTPPNESARSEKRAVDLPPTVRAPPAPAAPQGGP